MRKPYCIDFPQYLSECEYNYRRLRRLMPGWRSFGSGLNHGLNEYPSEQNGSIWGQNEDIEHQQWCYLSGEEIAQQNRIILSTKEIAKYTTTVHISVESQLQNQLRWFKNKRYSFRYALDARLYHDASIAEVISCDGHRRFLPRNPYPNRHMHQRDEKAQLNIFLGELLDDCLNSGRVDQQFHFATQDKNLEN